jgi:hypothetical protein
MARDLARLLGGEPSEHEQLQDAGIRMGGDRHFTLLWQTPDVKRCRVNAARHRVVILLMLAGL